MLISNAILSWLNKAYSVLAAESNMQCLENNTRFMSDYGLQIWQNGLNGSEHCFPESIMENGIGAILGTWCIINAVIGFFGNLLTLVAIPYASFNKRYINIFDISINI